jgi:hypothetical protein
MIPRKVQKEANRLARSIYPGKVLPWEEKGALKAAREIVRDSYLSGWVDGQAAALLAQIKHAQRGLRRKQQHTRIRRKT